MKRRSGDGTGIKRRKQKFASFASTGHLVTVLTEASWLRGKYAGACVMSDSEDCAYIYMPLRIIVDAFPDPSSSEDERKSGFTSSAVLFYPAVSHLT